MALQKSPVSIPLTGALDTEASPFVIPPGGLAEAENVYRDRTGRWTARSGRRALGTNLAGTGYALDSGSRLFSYRDCLHLASRRNTWQWQESLSRWGSSVPTTDPAGNEPAQHKLSTASRTNRALTGGGSQTDFCNPDVAIAEGIRFVAWDVANVTTYAGAASSRYAVIDDTTGRTLQTGTLGITGYPKVVYTEGRFVVFCQSTGGVLSCVNYLTNGTGLTGGGTVASDLKVSADCFYEAQARVDNGNVVVAYRSSANTLKALEWDPTGSAVSIAAVTVVASDVADQALGWLTQTEWAGSLYLVTCSSAATGTVFRTLSGTTLAQTATQTGEAVGRQIRNVTGFFDVTTKFCMYEEIAASPADQIVRWASSAGGTGVLHRGQGLISKAALAQQKTPGSGAYRPYWTTATQGELANSCFLHSGPEPAATTHSASALVGRISGENSGGLRPGRNSLASLTVGGSGRTLSLALLTRAPLTAFTTGSGAKSFWHNISVATVSLYADRVSQVPAEVGGLVLMPYSLTTAYDGVSHVAAGPAVNPEALTATPGTGGVGTMLNGAYQYVYLYARTDAAGRTWRSVPSIPVTAILAGADDEVTLSIPTLRVIPAVAGDQGYQIEIYRTTANGTIFRMIAILFDNDATVDAISFADNTTDTQLEPQEFLYTEGGVLENYQLPPSLCIVPRGSRCLGLDAEDRRRVWASKEITPGEAIATHPGLSVNIEDDGENTAMASLDGRDIIFKRAAIYYLSGEWPDNTGQGSLPIPHKICTSIGALSQESVVETRDGIYFKDVKGIYMLDRGLQAQYIGRPVSIYNSWTVVAANLLTSFQQVRFLVTSGVQGRELVWDSLHGTWSVFTLPNCTSGKSYVHAAVANGGKYYVLRSDGVVLVDDATLYQDDGSTYVCKLTTGCLIASGIEQAQRIYEISVTGQLLSTIPTPTVKLYYEGDLSLLVDTKAYSLSGGEYAVGNGRYVLKIRPSRQKGQAIQLSLTWIPVSSPASGGITVDALSLELGAKRGLRPVLAAATK